MKTYKTDQENFWAGKFGDEYISRNKSEELLASNLNFFCNALKKTPVITNCIEFGANIGMNLRALKLLYPSIEPYAVEINARAVEILSETIPKENIFNESVINFRPKRKWELVIIKGVLIHLNQNFLKEVYENLFNSSSKYILICEYYNPEPVMVNYRGNEEKLYKKRFCRGIFR